MVMGEKSMSPKSPTPLYPPLCGAGADTAPFQLLGQWCAMRGEDIEQQVRFWEGQQLQVVGDEGERAGQPGSRQLPLQR